jgi:protein-disulfide isomerase
MKGCALLVAALLMAAACGGEDSDDSARPASAGPVTGTPAAARTSEASSAPRTGTVNGLVDPLAAMERAAIPKELWDGSGLGSKSAKVTLQMFEDFQCPVCLRFTAGFERMLVEEYAATGKVRIEFENLPILGAESVAAAVGGVCAAQQNVFWPYHNRLFLEQARALQFRDEKLNIGRFSAGSLRTYATEAGADGAKWQACFDDPATLDIVQDDVRAASGFGIRGTPGLVANGKVLVTGSPRSEADFRKLLDDAIAGAK